MEVFNLLLLLAVLFFVMTGRSKNNEKLENLEAKLLELQRLIRQMGRADHAPKTDKPAEPVPEPAKPVELPHIPIPVPPAVTEETQEEVISDPIAAIRKPVPFRPSSHTVMPEPKPSFFERYPDLEKFIGENLINKVGIAILVLAIGFFVKYAIDNNWIGPIGRVGIGVLCGGILVGLAHWLRNSYKAFSSVLVGGGLAVLYLTITLAFHQFHLFAQTPAFVILIVITCFAVTLSLLYNRQELAVIALLGGVGSPFMVSTGQANYNALFLYIVMLNAGLLVIAYFKAWRILNASVFALTVILFGGIMYVLPANNCGTAMVYATVLYLLFFSINIANNVHRGKRFIAFDFTILLANTAVYFAAGLYLLTVMHSEYLRGSFSASLAALNLILSFILLRNRRADTNVVYLLIGITLTFTSLTAPIQLHGHSITLFWAAETVLLYWLYLKSGIKLMKLASLLVWLAMAISLFIDWMNIYGNSSLTLTIIANKGFITTLISAVGSWLLYYFMRQDISQQVYGIKTEPNLYRYAAVVLLFVSGMLEINHQFLSRYPQTGLNNLYLLLYLECFVCTYYLIWNKLNILPADRRVPLLLLIAGIIMWFFFYDQVFDNQYNMLVHQTVSTSHFTAHWIGAAVVGLLFYLLIQRLRLDYEEEVAKPISWIICGAVVVFLSLEVCLLSNMIFFSPQSSIGYIEDLYSRTALPVLWGLSSFAIMWLGMRYKARVLRVISLTLFSVTLVKLFVFDIRNIPPAGKIAAFFCLGVLLLIVSFMYQKVKKIIVADETE